MSNLYALKNDIKIGYAKPSKKHMFSFAKGDLPLNGSTMKFLLAMSKYIDSTNRIVIDVNILARKLHIQRKTLHGILREAKYYKLIYLKDGFYYSNFHVVTKGNSTEMEYIRLLDEYTSPVFLNYTLNLQRLLCYFLAASPMGTQQTYNIVQLYNNKMKMKKHRGIDTVKKTGGLDIFPTFKDLLNGLSVLVENDQIELKLINKATGHNIKLNSSNKNTKDILFAHFNMTEDKRKNRITNDVLYNELIQVKISKRLCQQNCKVIATEYEIEEMALANNFSFFDMPETQRNYLIGIKNSLMGFCPQSGATLFRKTLLNYFSEKGPLVLYHAQKEKAVNYFVDFYLLPEVRNILTGAALHQNIMATQLRDIKFNEILTAGYIVSLGDICGFIKFYSKYGSTGDMYLLHSNLRKHFINTSTFKHEGWSKFNEKLDLQVEPIINTCKTVFKEDVRSLDTYLTKLAESGVMSNKEKLEKELDRLLNIEPIIKANLNELILNIEDEDENRMKVPFYNWLEERE